MIPPRESADLGKFLWLLLVAAYGLFNAHSKWKSMSHEVLLSIGFEAAPLMPQLFIMRSDGHMITLPAKIFYDILVTVLEYTVPETIEKIDASFSLRAVVHGADPMRFFGINLFQHEDMTVGVNADEKLNIIATMQISRYDAERLTSQSTSSSRNSLHRSTHQLVGM